MESALDCTVIISGLVGATVACLLACYSATLSVFMVWKDTASTNDDTDLTHPEEDQLGADLEFEDGDYFPYGVERRCGPCFDIPQ